MNIEEQAMQYITTLKCGKLAATELPSDKRLLSKVVAILSEDYIQRGGEITYE